MINIELQNIYLNDVKENDLFCLMYLDTKVLGCSTRIYKTFKTFQELKQFCVDNSSKLDLHISNLTKEEIEQLEKYPNTDYVNVD